MSKVKLPQKLANEDGSFTVKLKKPIKWGEDCFESFKFREPVAKDIKSMKLQSLEMGDVLILAGKLCAQPPSVMDQLGMEDLFMVAEVIESFLPGSASSGNQA